MSAGSGLPPGVHLYAMCEPPGRAPRQLRILGDDERGYLVAGLGDLDDDEFWFEDLDMALARAARMGVKPDDWQSLTSVDQVQTGPPR